MDLDTMLGDPDYRRAMMDQVEMGLSRWELEQNYEEQMVQNERRKKKEKQDAKDDTLVAKLMDAIDKKYGPAFKKLMDTPDLNELIKDKR